MKYLVVSDIHGAAESAAAVPEIFAYHKADAILLLGDVLYHGPRNDLPADYNPKKVIDILNPLWHSIIAVRGNCDAEVDRMVLSFPITADYNLFRLGEHRVFMTHGHVYNPEEPPKLEEGDLFLSGHTHIPTVAERDGRWFLNPGSIALPKGNHPKSYGILDEDGFTVYALDHQEHMHVSFC
ncbi:MAG: phosphodiesterase [Solobacterium sp.]|nr:phosphodiesterase [Solobacterium sp.]